MSEAIITFQNFTFQYNAQSEATLHDINLDIHKGEKILIAGPSGCGKSTLAHCINGLIPFSYNGKMDGSVKIAGRESKNLSLFDISKTVGTVLQDTDAQFVGLTVAEDIAFALENQCVSGPELKARVLETAKKVNVDAFLHHAPTELSGGQKQRVSMAGVMVDDVEVYLFDEPLANLDPATGKAAIEMIDRIAETTGAAVIIIEHRLEDVLHRHEDRVILMEAGRIISDSSSDDLLSSDLLIKTGIREPLYVTALKYSGVKIRSEMHPSSIETLSLSSEDISMVQKWFRETKPAPLKSDRPILLKADSLDFSYSNGLHALKKISAEVKKGEIIAIVGTNGAGKSTFSKVLCGFEKEQSGSIFFNGEELASNSIKERADKIGYVMQNPNQMISKVMIFDEVALGLRTRGVNEDTIRTKVEDSLKICGLWPFRNWPVSALSYGQKKRVTIASILVLEPELIILDEVTAGQDYRHYTDIMEFLSRLNRKGITIIMITHDMHLMLEYAERALVFDDGKIISDAPCAEILTDSDIISRASLKETSLYALAQLCGIQEGREFVQRFIDYDREVSGR